MTRSERPLRRQPLNSVSAKIIAFVFLSTFLTALVVSWISIHSTHAYLRSQIDARFPVLLERATEGLEHRAETAQSRLAAVGSARLDHALERTPLFTALARLDASGNVRDSAGAPDAELAEIAARLSPIARPVTRAVATDETGAVLVAARPGRRGALIAVFAPEALRDVLQLTAVDAGGAVHLLDAEGRPIVASAPDGVTEANLRADPAELGDAAPGLVREYISSSGEHVLGSVLPVEGLGARLVIEEPFESAFRPVLDVVSRVFLSDLVIILLFSFLAYRITARIMKPIEALSEGARRISDGQLDTHVPEPDTGDEIGLLTRTFNDMVRKLRGNQLEIERANARLTSQYDELLSANEILAQLSITDGLTKLHNHRYFQDHLTREIKRVDRAGESLSMLLLDLDDFKQFNDRMGHSAGDELLLKIAGILTESIRQSDFLARYGGEEFVVLTPSTDLAGATALAEKIRTAVAETQHIVDDSLRPVRVTISAGVAEFHGDRKRFFQAADRALYRAKAEGKNCVVAADGPEAGA